MATLVAVNPKVVEGTMELVTRYVGENTAWKAGQILRINSSGALVAVSGGASTGGASYYALTERASAAGTQGYVEVGKISSDLVFEMHVVSGTVSTANIGQGYELDVTNGKVTVNTGSQTSKVVTILELGFNYDPAVNDSSDTLARVRVKFLQSVIDAAAAA